MSNVKDMLYIKPDNLQSKHHLLEAISHWTDTKQMKLNDEKSSYMIFNLAIKYKTQTFKKSKLLHRRVFLESKFCTKTP